MTINDAAVTTKASNFSYDWYRSDDYGFDPDVALATDDRADGELLALGESLFRHRNAYTYLSDRVDCLRKKVDAPDTSEIDRRWSRKEFEDTHSEMDALTDVMIDITEKMRTIPATTDAGKQVKARAVFVIWASESFYSGMKSSGEFEARVTELVAELCSMSPIALITSNPYRVVS